MAVVFLGLGSNLGNREAMLHEAQSQIALHESNRIVAASGLYESPALLPDDAPESWDMPFLNQVIQIHTALRPDALLALIARIEEALGRERRGHWGPREIDVDILAYGDVVYQSEALTLPHAEMTRRDFVLLPWCEISPDWRYPVEGALYGLTIRDLVNRLDSCTAIPYCREAA